MEWTNPDEETEYADQGDPEPGAEVLLRRLERIRRLVWLSVPDAIIVNEIKALTAEHETFVRARRGPMH